MHKVLTLGLLLILSFFLTVTGYAQEMNQSILLEHHQAPVFLQLSVQTYLVGDSDVSEREQMDKPPPSIARKAGGCCAGTLVSAGILWTGDLAVNLIANPADWENEPLWGFIGFNIGWVSGNAIGVYLVGNIGNEKGSFLATLVGSALGSVVGLTSWWSSVAITESEGVLYLGALISLLGSPIGALAGFDLTRTYDTPPAESEALINFRRGQMNFAVPRVYLRPDSFGSGSLSQRVDLVRMRF